MHSRSLPLIFLVILAPVLLCFSSVLDLLDVMLCVTLSMLLLKAGNRD